MRRYTSCCWTLDVHAPRTPQSRNLLRKIWFLEATRARNRMCYRHLSPMGTLPSETLQYLARHNSGCQWCGEPNRSGSALSKQTHDSWNMICGQIPVAMMFGHVQYIMMTHAGSWFDNRMMIWWWHDMTWYMIRINIENNISDPVLLLTFDNYMSFSHCDVTQQLHLGGPTSHVLHWWGTRGAKTSSCGTCHLAARAGPWSIRSLSYEWWPCKRYSYEWCMTMNAIAMNCD